MTKKIEQIGEEEIQEIISDYNEHFEELNFVLTLILNTSENIHLLAGPGWGKTFFMNLVKNECKCFEDFTQFKKECNEKSNVSKLFLSVYETEKIEGVITLDKREDSTKLNEREVFQKYGSELYFNVIGYYIDTHIKLSKMMEKE